MSDKCIHCGKPYVSHGTRHEEPGFRFCGGRQPTVYEPTPLEERTAEQIAAFVELCLDPPNETSRLLVAGIRSGAWRTSK